MDTSKMFLNEPIPGEAITQKLGKYPFDNPPLIASAPEAMEYLLETYLSNNKQDEILKLIIAGVTIELLVNVMVKTAFMNGIITVDVAEIIKTALLLHILADARDAGVKNIKIMNDSVMPEVSPEDFINIRNELRADEMVEIEIELPEDSESFLDMENI